MRFKAVNPNPRHEAAHALVLGCTGSGKSQLLKSGQVVPLTASRVIGYDDVGSLPGLYYTTRAGFLRALLSGKRHGTFRVFYAGNKSAADYAWWCEVLWSQLDGDHLTYAVTEELATVSTTTGKAQGPMLVMMNEGRKYGLRHIGTTQKPTEIPKTYYSQSRVKFVGQQAMADVERMAREANVAPSQILTLKCGEFYRYEGGAEPGKLVRARLSAPVGVRWMD